MSEPVFEASVRLRVDVAPVEEQAKASLQRVLDEAERKVNEVTKRLQQIVVPAPAAPAPRDLAKELEVLKHRSGHSLDPEVAVLEASIARGGPTSLEHFPANWAEIASAKDQIAAVTRELEAAKKAAAEARLALETPIEVPPIEVPPVEVPPVPPVEVPVRPLLNADERLGAELERQLATPPVKVPAELVPDTDRWEQRKAELAREQQQLDAANAARAARDEQERAVRRGQAEAEQARLQPILDLQTRSETAATKSITAEILGDTAGAEAQRLESTVLAMQGASETFKLNAVDLLTQSASFTGLQQQQLVADAEQSVAAAELLRREAIRLREEGLPPVVPPAGGRPGGAVSPVGRFRELIGGREAGVAGILGQTARFGVAGLAFSAAFEGLGELQKQLRVTGEEAFKSQGRLRNMAGELLQGHLIGAVGALRAVPKTLEDLGISASTSEEKLQALAAIASGELKRAWDDTTAGSSEAKEAELAYKDAAKLAGTTNQELAASAVGVVRELREQAAATGEVLRATLALRDAQGRTLPGFVQGLRPAPAPPPLPPAFSPFPSAAAGQKIIEQQQQAEAERAGNLQVQLRIAQQQHDRATTLLHATKRVADENGKITPLYQTRIDEEIKTAGNLARLQGLIKQGNQSLADANREAALASAQRAGDVGGERAALEDAAAAADRAVEAARKKRKTDPGALAAAISAQTAADTALDTFNDTQKELAKTAAETAAASAQNAREQGLANNIAKAELEGRRADVIKFTNVAIAYYRAIANDASASAEEREAARSQVLSLRGSLKGGGTEGLELQKLQNALQQAEFAGSIPLQRAAANKIVAYWQEQVKSLSGMEKAVAQANLITAQGNAQQVAAAGTALQLKLLQNAQAAARLTPGGADDKLAGERIVGFWERQVKLANETAREIARNTRDFVVGKPKGLLAAGNLDILHRKSVELADGMMASVRSFSVPAKEFGRGKGEILLPSIINGIAVSQKQAIEHFRKTGENLGTFSSVKTANAYADALHRQQEALGKSLAKGTKTIAQAEAEGNLIAAKLALQGEAISEKAGTTVFDLLSQFTDTFKNVGGNLVDINNPFAGPSGFTNIVEPFLARREFETPQQRFPGKVADDVLLSPINSLADAIRENTAAWKGSKPVVTASRTVAAAWTGEQLSGPLSERFQAAERQRQQLQANNG